MDGNGWVKLHRKFLGWEWYQKKYMVHLFLHLLLSANHKSKKWQGVIVNRGQLITGLKSLSASTGISVRSLRTCLARVVDIGGIIKKPTNKYSIITICNYEKYQIDGRESDKQPTSNRQATDNKQECKEVKKKDIYPDWLDLNLWKEFKKMRVRIKSPLTDHAEKLAITELKKLLAKGGDQSAVINQAILKSWKSFYPVKTKQQDPKPTGPAYQEYNPEDAPV